MRQTKTQDLAHLGTPRLCTNTWPGGRCAGCGGTVEFESTIAYYPDAPRGYKAWHPECVGADPAALAVTKTQAQLGRAMERHRLKQGDDDRRQALRDAYLAVVAWLGQPQMRGLAEAVCGDIARCHDAAPVPVPVPSKTAGKGRLRLVAG